MLSALSKTTLTHSVITKKRTRGAISTAAILSILAVPSLSAQAYERIVAMSSDCLLYTSPSPRDKRQSRMPSSA